MLQNIKMSYSVIWEWLFSFDSGDGVVSLIPLSISSQTNSWKIKQLQRNEHVLYLPCFFFPPEVCLLKAVLLYSPVRGVYSQEMTKNKLKSLGKSMIYCRGRDRGQTHLSFFSLFLSCKIFIPTDRYPIILDLFSYMGKLWPRFCQDSKSVGKYLLSIYYMLSPLLDPADTLVTTQNAAPSTKGARELVGKTNTKEIISFSKC